MVDATEWWWCDVEQCYMCDQAGAGWPGLGWVDHGQWDDAQPEGHWPGNWSTQHQHGDIKTLYLTWLLTRIFIVQLINVLHILLVDDVMYEFISPCLSQCWEHGTQWVGMIAWLDTGHNVNNRPEHKMLSVHGFTFISRSNKIALVVHWWRQFVAGETKWHILELSWPHQPLLSSIIIM